MHEGSGENSEEESHMADRDERIHSRCRYSLHVKVDGRFYSYCLVFCVEKLVDGISRSVVIFWFLVKFLGSYMAWVRYNGQRMI
ncbi:hypothetical protein J2S04_002795 [Alicyclobacillus tengchongensis]|uniref:Uncharacterized protein n=2 Tax=Alicyclobacillus tolerans TaxID=90970 RepID=A0ABT9LZV3_9BACL|nr:hypothetical protein [Alicyclobacillus tengchongensis]SHL15687.1 hypothetical protein SAMN05443507_1482 [Alicyclobacillus montanus]